MRWSQVYFPNRFHSKPLNASSISQRQSQFGALETLEPFPNDREKSTKQPSPFVWFGHSCLEFFNTSFVWHSPSLNSIQLNGMKNERKNVHTQQSIKRKKNRWVHTKSQPKLQIDRNTILFARLNFPPRRNGEYSFRFVGDYYYVIIISLSGLSSVPSSQHNWIASCFSWCTQPILPEKTTHINNQAMKIVSQRVQDELKTIC